MLKKIFIGMLAVAIAIGIAGSGYKFGKYLAQTDDANKSSQTTSDFADG